MLERAIGYDSPLSLCEVTLALRSVTTPSNLEYDAPERVVVSVLLTDYGDHTYSEAALSSANSQNCDPDQMEIIILVEQDAGVLTSLLPTIRFPYKVVPTGPIPIGQAYAVGVTVAKGKVICFLDNDDVWDSSHVAMVIRALNRYRNAVLFKNAAIPIFEDLWHDSRSKRLYDFSMGIRQVSLEQDALIVVKTPFELKRVSHLAPIHNMSSIAVRREILLKQLDTVIQIQFFVDISIVLISLASGSPIIFCAVPLTLYRVRDLSLSNRGIVRAKGTLTSDSWKAYAAYQSIFKRLRQQPECPKVAGLPDVTDMLQFATGTFLFLRTGLPRANELSKGAPRQLITSLRLGFTNFAWGALLMLAARFAPTPIRIIYLKFLHGTQFR